MPVKKNMTAKKSNKRKTTVFLLFVLVHVMMGSAHSATMMIYDNVPLDNSTGEMPARLVPLPPEQTRIAEGMLDVTKPPYNADNTGNTDAHAAIQNAIDDAYAANLTVFFPSGTYLSSDKLTCFQTNAQDKLTSRKFVHQLVGSTEGSRPVLKLMDNAPLVFDDADGSTSAAYPLFIHFSWRGTESEVFSEVGYRNYCATFRGIDIDMGNNPNNSAIRMNSAQYSVLEDVHIYGDAFAYGVDVTPGGGGSTSNLKVTGGTIGVKTGRTAPSIAGLTLENQSEIGLHIDGIGAGIVTGFSIKAPASPTSSYRAVYARGTQTGHTANNDNIALVDGTIEVPGSTGTAAIYNYDQDVHMQNVYVKASNIIESGSRYTPSDILAGNSSSWQHVRRYAFRCGTDSAPIVIDGVSQGSADADHEYYEPLLTVSAPPTHLINRHVWSESEFPSWEDTERISITDFGAVPENDPESSYDNAPSIQAALDSATTVGSSDYGKTVFIPRGIFNVSSPITVPAGAKLIGAGNAYSQLDVSESWAPTSATSVLTTVDDPTAEVVLAYFAIVCNTALDADRAAQQYIRHATIQSGKTLWRNIQIDTRSKGGTNRLLTEPIVLITGNAGGRFYNMVNDNSYGDLASGHPQSTHHKLKVSNTTLPISFYQLNPEHLEQPTGQVSLENCQDVRFFSFKAEYTGRLLTATNVAHLQLFGTEGIYRVEADGYIVLDGQCEDVRLTTLGHRLGSSDSYVNSILEDTNAGYSIPDRATVALYAKNAPQLQLHDGDTINDPELFDGGDGADFGQVSSGATVTKTFTIYNGGFADLTSLAVTVDGTDSGEFAVSSPDSTTVTPGATTAFTISFTPIAPGNSTATVHIASNDPGADPFDINLGGTGAGSDTDSGTDTDNDGDTDSDGDNDTDDIGNGDDAESCGCLIVGDLRGANMFSLLINLF